MLHVIGFADVAQILPLLFIPVILMVIFAVIIITISKKLKSDKSARQSNKTAAVTDGNGRTQHQRDYINGLRVRQAEKKIVSADGSHSHSGKEERYEPIVGSLGEVDDEGCDELDGVRLIEHDESYCDDPQHLAAADYETLEQAIVIGEVINAPRFKNPYGKR